MCPGIAFIAAPCLRAAALATPLQTLHWQSFANDRPPRHPMVTWAATSGQGQPANAALTPWMTADMVPV